MDGPSRQKFMNELAKLLEARLKSNGFETNNNTLVMAPGFGGDYSNSGLSMRKGNISADTGEYSTNAGKNYYGYGGVQPMNIGGVSLGGALGAYGNQDKLNALAGLLASIPVMNGEARMMLSPINNALFMGYQKRF